MRDEHPVFYDEIGDVWWLSRYHDVAAVFADHLTYSAATYEQSTGRVLGPTLISRDDHGHVVRRSIVAPDFVGSQQIVERCPGIRPAPGPKLRPRLQGNSFQALPAFPLLFDRVR